MRVGYVVFSGRGRGAENPARVTDASASVDFAELVDACRALEVELPDEHENAAINAALRRIRAIVGKGVKMPQEGGKQ